MNSNPTSHLKLSLASLTALLGTGASIYLTQLYYKIRSGTAGFQSLCNVAEGMNCDVAATSKWAELAPGLPLSSLVAGWFVTLLVLTVLARITDWRKDVAKIGAWMSGLGLVYGAFLLYIMITKLQSLCIFCVAVDVANLVLFVIFMSMKDGPLFQGVSLKRIKSAGILAVVCIFVMVVILRPVDPGRANSSSEIELMAQSVLNAKIEPVTVPATSPVLGNPNAPITVVEFSDFQCPYCARAAVILNSVVARYPNQVRVVFRHFPLDGSCNREMKGSMHPHACALARAAVCANKSGKFKPTYESIFDEQASLNPSSATDLPIKAGVPEAELKECLNAEETKSIVGADIEEGIALKIQSTPTIFVNGRRMDGAYPLEVWDKVIEGLSK